MKKYYFVIQALVALVIFSLIGMTTLPTKVDVENLEVVEVIGLDKSENGVKVTAILKKNGEQSSSDTSEQTSSSSKYKAVTVEAMSFSQAVDILRNVTDKYISLSHVKYYIVGEPTAKESLRDVIDYLSRTDDLESTSRLLVADSYSAQDFLKKVVDSDEDIVSNIQDKTSDLVSRNDTVKVTVLDILDMFLQDKIQGVVPYISVIGGKGESTAFEKYDGSETKTDTFGFEKVGIIYDMKVEDVLSKNEIVWYNMVLADVQSIVMLVPMSDNGSVVINCNREKHKLSFDVKDSKVTSINLELEFIANIEEARTSEKLFDIEYITKVQENCQKEMENNITTAIKKCIESDIDYMKLGSEFELQHPYVFMKLKDNFLENLKTADIKVDVNISLNNTYDVMQSNIYQREGK